MKIADARVPLADEKDWRCSLPAYCPESERRVEEIAHRVLTGVILGTITAMVAGPLRGMVLGALTTGASLVQYVFQQSFAVERQVLQTLEKTSSSDPALMTAIAKLQRIFSYEKILLFQYYELHTFYKDVTVITDKMVTSQQKALWKNFLDALEGEEVFFIQDRSIRLSFSMQQERLNGKKPVFTVEKIDFHHHFFSPDFLQIAALEEGCYQLGDRIPADEIKKNLRRKGSFCYVARKKESGEILGCLWGTASRCSRASTDILRIVGVARKASLARLGIGNKLMSRFVQDAATSTIGLHVRKSNEHAIALYQRWGFQVIGKEKTFYTRPAETALIMQKKRSRN